MGKVDLDDPRPPYQQVADQLRLDIRSGVLDRGRKLPKQPDLSEEFGVSITTIKSALAVLRDEGLIVSRQGEGSWVCRELPDPSPEPESRDQTVEHMLGEVLDRLTTISERLDGVERRLGRD